MKVSSSTLWKVTIVTIILVTYAATVSCQTKLLPHFHVFRDNITLSGYSSGGAMAQMLQISYSSLFKGIAVFSHTYYRCGPPNADIDDYDRYCTTLFNFTDSQMWNTSMVHENIKEYHSMGIIENPENLRNKRLYVYSGTRNFLFTPTQSLKILEVYEPYIRNPSAIRTRVQDAVQLLPSNSYGSSCTESAEKTEYIGNCGFSGVTEALNFILFDDVVSPDVFQPPTKSKGKITSFNQTEFTKDLQNHNMDDIGYYYVPKRCLGNGGRPKDCFLHFYMHGCFVGRCPSASGSDGPEFMGQKHLENSGLLELADRKGIIMMFPQAKSSNLNKIGCWDTFGMAGKYYATQRGPQVTALKRMLDRILSRTK